MQRVNLTLAFKKRSSKTSIVGKLVSWWTKSIYHHVELVIDNKWISADSDTGVIVRDLQPFKSNWEYISIDGITITNKQYIILDKFINSVNGSDYDWKAIFLSQVLRLGMQSNKRWFCSELVTKLLQICVVEKVIHLEPHRVTPKDLHNIFTS